VVSEKIFAERYRLLALGLLSWVVARVLNGTGLAFGYRYDPLKDILNFHFLAAWLEWEMARSEMSYPRTDYEAIIQQARALPCVTEELHSHYLGVHIPHAYILGVDCPSSLRDEERLRGRLEYRPKEG